MKISLNGGLFFGNFSVALPKPDPVVYSVTIVRTAKTPSKRDARRARRKVTK